MIVDFAIGRLTFAWRHYFYAVAYGVTYLVFNAIYTLTTGIPLYSILTWKSAFTAAVIAGVFVFLVIIFGVFWALGRCRDRNRADALVASTSGAIEMQHH